MSRTRNVALGVLALILAGCGGGDGAPVDPSANAPVRPESQLTFLRLQRGVALSSESVSFWAVRGKDREASLYFRPDPGKTDSVRFLRFKVADGSLLRRPDGRAFAFGDSILITIRVRDLSRVLAEFSPSGLVFNPLEPAELRMDFEKADDDYDGDGDTDAADELRVSNFAIWKQEFAGQPWVRLSSRAEISADLREIEAQILSFTNHAVAY